MDAGAGEWRTWARAWGTGRASGGFGGWVLGTGFTGVCASAGCWARASRVFGALGCCKEMDAAELRCLRVSGANFSADGLGTGEVFASFCLCDHSYHS